MTMYKLLVGQNQHIE